MRVCRPTRFKGIFISTSHVPGSNYSFALKRRKSTQWRPQKPAPGRTTQVEPMSSSSLWFSIYALGKAHNMRSTPSLGSFPNVASVSNSSNVRLIVDDPLSSFRRARPLSTPLSSRRPMVWCLVTAGNDSSRHRRYIRDCSTTLLVAILSVAGSNDWDDWEWDATIIMVSNTPDTPAGVMHRKFG